MTVKKSQLSLCELNYIATLYTGLELWPFNVRYFFRALVTFDKAARRNSKEINKPTGFPYGMRLPEEWSLGWSYQQNFI
jgi:hypothetical protein